MAGNQEGYRYNQCQCGSVEEMKRKIRTIKKHQEDEKTTMWKCPKCGREFKKKEQSHYCGEKPNNIDEYILSQEEDK